MINKYFLLCLSVVIIALLLFFRNDLILLTAGGRPAPKVNFITYAGDQVASFDTSGPTYLYFWSLHEPSSLSELIALQKLINAGSADVNSVLTVNVDPESEKSAVANWIDKNEISIRFAFDASRAFFKESGTDVVPSVWLINNDGTIDNAGTRLPSKFNRRQIEGRRR